jgi:acyl-CoA synthetase
VDLQVWSEAMTNEQYENGWWDAETVSDRIRVLAGESGDALAFIDDFGSMSWREYDLLGDQVAGALSAAGGQRGDAVVVVMPDCAALHGVWVGAERAGMVVVSLAKRTGPADVQRVLGLAETDLLLTGIDQRSTELVAALRASGWEGRHLTIAPGGPFVLQLDGRSAPVGETAGLQPLTADELFLINLTSGTTGLPKLVMHTQNRWKYQVAKCVQFEPGDVFLVLVPASGGFGLWMSHFSPLKHGSTAVLVSEFDAAAGLRAIEHHKVTVCVCVPTQIKMMLAHPEISTVDFTHLRILETGGESVTSHSAREFERISRSRVVQFYGSNESGSLSGTAELPVDDPLRFETSGRVFPEMFPRLIGEDGAYLEGPGRGRIAVRGPGNSPGYLRDPAANAGLRREDGWLLLGDIVEIDAQGYIRVVGRASDFVIRGGLNISCVEVEDDVIAHDRVAQACAVAIPDPVFGERVCVFVSSRDGRDVTLEEITADLAGRGISKSSWPEHVVNLREMPIAAGKTAKGQLQQHAARLVLDPDFTLGTTPLPAAPAT